ncbi:MAG: NRDE family protein, partial [Pseudomonadota bacterium]
MCLIAFAIGASSRWPLLIASNRDEFFDRPAAALMRWQTETGQDIISGRDLRAGGAWLGMTPQGRVAMLTNVRELPAAAGEAAAQKSRGELVIRWLETDMNADQFMAQTDNTAYGGFNLVLGDLQTGNWNWLSNRSFDRLATGAGAHRPANTGWTSQVLSPGIYGLSNAALNTPWPKT